MGLQIHVDDELMNNAHEVRLSKEAGVGKRSAGTQGHLKSIKPGSGMVN